MKRKESMRVIAALLAGTMMTVGLAGCGNSAKGTKAAKMSEATVSESVTYGADEYESLEEPIEDTGYASTEATKFAEEEYQEACYDVVPWTDEKYEAQTETGFVQVKDQPLSTFSADVDTASYANIRRMIQDGYALSDIDQDAVRPEEMINYFSYELQMPKRGEKFGITTELSACPWNAEHELMMVGMATQQLDLSERPDSNLVFLLDVSGSMDEPDKLPLLQKSFQQLTENLTKKDRVSIVTYASGVEAVLKNVRGDEMDKINSAIDSLYASGGTNGEGGIQLAYQLAEKSFIKGGNNRVILATDGDLNIGVSEPEELEKLISKKKESGIYLSVLGFGTGNIRDDNMERLADKGNGNYAYIDSLFEAKKVLVEEMGATLVTVAKDVKLQTEFNPENVREYRLIGYENRRMADRDFYDDTKDAGEIGAGHQVVALYEIVPENAADEIELKYGQKEKSEKALKKSNYGDEYATVKISYKEPDEDESRISSYVVNTESFSENPSRSLRFASLVAEYALILSDSAYQGAASLEDILTRYQEMRDGSSFFDEYKEEFYYLVKTLSTNL